MTQPIITEDIIRTGATADIFQRGRQYFQHGAVVALALHGRALTADVRGSRSRPYRVTAELPTSPNEEIEATCTCPYEWGGWCKHIVAALLAYITDPSIVAERPLLEELLATLTREQLQATLIHLASSDDDLANAIEEYATTFTTVTAEAPAGSGSSAGATPAGSAAPVDAARLRREVKTAIRYASRSGRSDRYDEYDDYDDHDYYDRMDDVYGEMRPFIQQARDAIAAQDGRTALRILEVITDEFLTVWAPDEDGNGSGYSFFQEVTPLWTEALLSEDFTRDERKGWARLLTDWSDQTGQSEIADFSSALSAASEGWDHPQLQRILRGELTDEERRAIEEQVAQSRLKRFPWLARRAVEDAARAPKPNTGVLRIGANADGQIIVEPYMPSQSGVDESGDQLIKARLRVLARQGRYDEYLTFARLMGEPLAYTLRLVERGRMDEAAAYGREYLSAPESAQALATALLERDAPALAFAVAERGLALGGRRTELARWLRDAASERGETALALSAALVVYQEAISLENYLAVQRLAGDRWPARRDELLKIAGQSRYSSAGPVDIFLHEGLLDDAIQAVSASTSIHSFSYYGLDTTLEKVVAAAMKKRPDWVIQTCSKLAERIMDEGASGHYEDAAKLLRKAREAYRGADRQAEWQAYLEAMITRHRRKYRLTPLLKALA